MAKNTTRQKILDKKAKLLASYDNQVLLLKAMWDLAQDRSEILNRVSAPIMFAIEQQKMLVEKMLEGL